MGTILNQEVRSISSRGSKQSNQNSHQNSERSSNLSRSTIVRQSNSLLGAAAAEQVENQRIGGLASSLIILDKAMPDAHRQTNNKNGLMSSARRLAQSQDQEFVRPSQLLFPQTAQIPNGQAGQIMMTEECNSEIDDSLDHKESNSTLRLRDQEEVIASFL